jgi:hypothetical protein
VFSIAANTSNTICVAPPDGALITFARAAFFSPVSLAYDKLRKVVFDFVVGNWKQVRTTETWNALEEVGQAIDRFGRDGRGQSRVLFQGFDECGFAFRDYQQIDVRETAYSTMCAVLLYLQTGHIKFAPIRSAIDRFGRDGRGQSRVLFQGFDECGFAFRDELVREKHLALDSFASSLTVSGAADELFSPVSLAYDKLRKVWARREGAKSGALPGLRRVRLCVS